MRWTSCTPGSTSRLRVSKSMRGPTAASTVWRTPVVRWTEKPMRTRCSMTCWICSSVAASCMATIMVSLSRADARRRVRPKASVVHIRIEFGIGPRRVSFGAGSNLFLLNLAHDVHDALVNAPEVGGGQRPGVCLLDIFEDGLLAVRLVDGHGGGALELADFVGSLGALAEQVYQLAVNLVDFFAPVADVHGDDRVSGRGRYGVARPTVVLQILPQTRLPGRDSAQWFPR